jgi:thioredoxin-related protein
MKKLLGFLIITVILSSCKTKNDGFTITGHIEGIKDSTLITLYDMDQRINLDSAFSINGDFELRGNVEYPTGCFIHCEGEYANIQVENVEMSFTSPIEDMHLHNKITGGKEQELQNELKKLQQPYDLIYFSAYDSLMNKKYSNNEEEQSLIKKFNENQSTSEQIYIDFGKNHSESFLGLDIIYSNRSSIPKDSIKIIYENLNSSFKQTPIAKALEVFLYEAKAEIGKPFIDFEVKSLNGENFKLSSLKGKYIYLCFWSPGCGYCHMKNKFISQNYSKIPEDLSIVSFSVGKNKDEWAKVSKENNIIWHNVSDNAGEKGRIKTQYGIQGTPNSFLINKEGIIIKRFYGFSPDEDFIEDLKKIMKENK